MPATGIAVTVEAVTAVSRERAFAAIVPIDLTRVFTGLGPLPAVVGVHEQTGEWDHAGATRKVELGDGSLLDERLIACEAPSHFAYEVSGFTGAIGRLVSGADGAWWFSDGPGDGTSIRWTYVFRPRRGRAALVLAGVAPAWRLYARRGLARTVAAAESGG